MNINIIENLKTIDLKNLNMNKKSILMLFGSILICLSAGIIGKLAVSTESLIWYDYLFKPALNPSNWLFQGIWVILYLLMGISLYLVLNSENINQEAFLNRLKKIGINLEPHVDIEKKNDKKHALILFGIQLFLSVILIPVFFGLRSTLGGFLISILMWASICLMLYKFYKVTIPAALLTIPAVLWSAYLVGLNLTFWMLNSTQWAFWSFKHNLL